MTGIAGSADYPASGHAYISDDGCLCITWREQKVVLVIGPDGVGMVGTGEHCCKNAREIKLDNPNWPIELRCVMSDDYISTLEDER